MKTPRWCYVVSAIDRQCGIGHRERFLFPADAKHRARQLREAGFYSVRVSEHRVKATGPTLPTRPGFTSLPHERLPANDMDICVH